MIILSPHADESYKDGGVIRGPDFNKNISFDELFENMVTMGFQATNVGLAINEIRHMLSYRLSDDEYDPQREFP